MKDRPAAAADEYNEDTDRANDSDEDLWNDKLVIDEQPNVYATDKMNSQSTQHKDGLIESKDSISDISASVKHKGKRGAKKKADCNTHKQDQNEENQLPSSSKVSSHKQLKVEKSEKPAPNKPGRKRKDRLMPDPKGVSGDAENLFSDKEGTGTFSFDKKDDGISSTTVGKRSAKLEAVATKDSATEYDWRSVGSITEPENLGPCESGTQVCLEGIVWQETNNGVLIVNVTWRGKSYMGTLLDATKYDWSPPSCESPVSEFDGRTPKNRGKRSRVPLSDTFKDINERKLRKEIRRQSAANQPATKLENGKGQVKSADCQSIEPSSKRSCTSSHSSSTSDHLPTHFECPEPNCGKRYKNRNGLKYHLRNSHSENPSNMSDSASDNERLESMSSPDDLNNLPTTQKEETGKANAPESEINSTSKAEPEHDTSATIQPVRSVVSTPVSTYTTSVIASTSFTNPNNSISQPSTVPVAAITPQVIKPSTADRDQQKSNLMSLNSMSRSQQFPHKLLPKGTNNIAPISTITSPGVYNPSLKPIQPKPTRLPDATINPSLNDLRDQKKLKRKRSASKDDLCTSSNNEQKSIPQTDESRTGGLMYDMPGDLKSPSNFSDISDDGEKRHGTKKETQMSSDSAGSNLVATVSPQKTHVKTEAEKEHYKKAESALAMKEEKNIKTEAEMRQSQELLHPFHPFQMAGWQMPPELVQMLMARDMSLKAGLTHPDFAKLTGHSVNRNTELKMVNERQQFLKENMEMKLQPSYSISDSPKECPASFSGLQRGAEDLSKAAGPSEKKQEQPRRDSVTSRPHTNKTQPACKPSDARMDFSKPSQFPQMLPPFNPASLPFNFPNNFMLGAPISLPLPGVTELRDSANRTSASPLYPFNSSESVKSSPSPRPSNTPDRMNPAKQPVIPPVMFPYNSVSPKLQPQGQ